MPDSHAHTHTVAVMLLLWLTLAGVEEESGAAVPENDPDADLVEKPAAVTTPEMIEAAVAMRTRARSKTTTSASTSSAHANATGTNKQHYGATDYVWGAELQSATMLSELEKKPIEQVIEAVPLPRKQQMKYKVQLKGQPLHKALYVDEDEIPAQVLADWRAQQLPSKVFEMVSVLKGGGV